MNRMQRIASFFFWNFLCVLAIAAETRPFSEYKPDLGVTRPIVKEIIFLDDSGKQLAPEKFQEFLQLKTDSEFDVKLMSDDVDTIRKNFPEFISITNRIEPFSKDDKDSIKIVYEFLRKRFIQYVRIKAAGGVELDAAVQGQLRCKPGRLLRGEEVKPDEEVLRRAFVAKGFPKAKIKSEIKVLDSQRGTVELIFSAELGSKAMKVQKVEFLGVKNHSTETLAGKILTQPEGGWSFSNFFNMFSGEDNFFNATELDNDAKRIEEDYKSIGFADIKVSSHYQTVSSNYVVVQFKIQEGRKYSVQKINVTGQSKISRAQVLALLTFKEGSPYSGKAFRNSMQKLREYYGNKGYASMHVHFDFDVKTKTLTIQITEGSIQYIDRVEIVGHQGIEEKLIRSYFPMKEGDRVNTQLIAESIESLRKTGFFDEVQVAYVPQRLNAGKILITVKEASKASVDVGFGYGTASGLTGDIGYSLRQNGMDLSIRAMQTEEETKLMLLFKKPRFMDTKNDLIAGGGYQDLDYGGFSKESIQARVMLEREIIKNLTIGVGTRIEFVGIHDIAPGMPIEVYDAATKKHLVAGVVSTLVYNHEKVDKDGEAYDGYRIRMAMLPSFADEEVYLKASATILAHKTLVENSNGKKHIITGRLTLGYASSNTPFYDGMYTGGSTVLRGSNRGTINPNGSKLPGNAVIGAGTYYSFPLYGEMFRGVAFMEGLAVGQNVNSLGSIRVVGGVGVRANMMDTFLKTNVEGGFVFPAIKQTEDSFKPFYLMLGNYHPMYDL